MAALCDNCLPGVFVFITAVLVVVTINRETNIATRTENLLKVLIGWRLSHGLFTIREGTEFVATQ